MMTKIVIDGNPVEQNKFIFGCQPAYNLWKVGSRTKFSVFQQIRGTINTVLKNRGQVVSY